MSVYNGAWKTPPIGDQCCGRTLYESEKKTKYILNLYECCDVWYWIQQKKLQNGGMLTLIINFSYLSDHCTSSM